MTSEGFESEVLANLHDLASKYQSSLPAGFRDYNSYAEEELSNGRWPSHWTSRSQGRDKGVALAEAVLEELKVLICGSDPRYEEVAKSGKDFAQKAIAVVAGYVAASFGIEIAMATSAVAASMLVVVRVGTGAFCRALK
jgi:hypothetical protein